MPEDRGSDDGRSTWVGVALVLVSTAMFGAIPAVVTFLRDDMPLVDVVTYRGLLAAAMLLCLSLVVERDGIRSGRPSAATNAAAAARRHAGVLIGACLYAPQLMLFYSAFDRIDTSLAVSLGFVYPTFVILFLAARQRTRPRAGELAAAAVALGGIVALTDPGSATVDPAGVWLVVAASGLFAVYVVVAGDVVADMPPLRVGAEVSAGVGLAIGAYGVFVTGLGAPDGWSQWAALATQTVMLVVAIATYYTGLARLGASTTSLIDCAQPLFAVMAGGLLLGERLVVVQLLGVVLVIVAVAMTAVRARRQAPVADAA